MDAPAALKTWRGDRTLRVAGALLGCDPSYVAYLEKGQRTPPLDLAVRIEDLTGIPVRAWVQSSGSGATPAAGAHG